MHFFTYWMFFKVLKKASCNKRTIDPNYLKFHLYAPQAMGISSIWLKVLKIALPDGSACVVKFGYEHDTRTMAINS